MKIEEMRDKLLEQLYKETTAALGSDKCGDKIELLCKVLNVFSFALPKRESGSK